jgi:hypothetical protein
MQKMPAARRAALAAGLDAESAALPPSYVYKRGDLEVTSHMRDWVDCIRSRQTPRCGMDRAYDEAVVIVMAVESYFKERKVKWDPVNEVIV